MRTAIAAIATLIAMVEPGNGEPEILPPEPVVAIDDVRSHAPILWEGYQLGATYRYLFHGAENRDLATVQAALGPIAFEEPHLRTLLSWIRRNSVRIRATATGILDDPQVGPLTVALQHYVVVDALDIAPLLHLVFLFAHHGLSDIIIGDGVPPKDRNAPSPLEKLLVDHNRRQHNIIGFLYGHHHEHALCKEGQGGPRRTVCSSFYEIETAGVVEFPQEGRVVRIKELGGGIAFLELTTFGARLADGDEFSNVVARARRGAERDYCRTKPGARCSEDLHPYRDDGSETNARLFFALPENAPHAR